MQLGGSLIFISSIHTSNPKPLDMVFKTLVIMLIAAAISETFGATGVVVKEKQFPVPASVKNAKCTCDGNEIKDGKLAREFKVNCKTVQSSKDKKGKTVSVQLWRTSCIYGGEPHRCGNKYNKNGQQKFYEELMNLMGNDYCATQPPTQTCLTTKTYTVSYCPESPFTFNRFN